MGFVVLHMEKAHGPTGEVEVSTAVPTPLLEK